MVGSRCEARRRRAARPHTPTQVSTLALNCASLYQVLPRCTYYYLPWFWDLVYTQSTQLYSHLELLNCVFCPQIIPQWVRALTACEPGTVPGHSSSLICSVLLPCALPPSTLCPKDPPRAIGGHVRWHTLPRLSTVHWWADPTSHCTHFIPQQGRELPDHQLFHAYSKIRPRVTLIPTFQSQNWADYLTHNHKMQNWTGMVSFSS